MILSPETLGFQKTELENSYRLELPGHYVLQTYQHGSRAKWFLFDQRDEKLEGGFVFNINHGCYVEAITAARRALNAVTEKHRNIIEQHQKALDALDEVLIGALDEA